VAAKATTLGLVSLEHIDSNGPNIASGFFKISSRRAGAAKRSSFTVILRAVNNPGVHPVPRQR
jgi:hypothetical protein